MLTSAGYGTATWFEIAWTVAAIPGFLLWFNSWLSSRTTLKAIRSLRKTNGRLLWARFSVRLTTLMLVIEVGFVTIGLIAMTRDSPDNSTVTANLIIASVLIGVSVLISLLAYQWREVEEQILNMARIRRAEGLALDIRQEQQNSRDTDQNLRTFRLDERERESKTREEDTK